MRVEGIEVEFPADVDGAVGAQDVEGEAAEPGEVAGFGSNAALVFEEADIADVVAAVFDAQRWRIAAAVALADRLI